MLTNNLALNGDENKTMTISPEYGDPNATTVAALQEAETAIAALAKRFWSIHPKEIQDLGITREQFYEREMRALLVALTHAQPQAVWMPMDTANPEVVTVVERAMKADEALGKWMSAALADPKVCAEMKMDVLEWFEAHKPSSALSRPVLGGN